MDKSRQILNTSEIEIYNVVINPFVLYGLILGRSVVYEKFVKMLELGLMREPYIIRIRESSELPEKVEDHRT